MAPKTAGTNCLTKSEDALVKTVAHSSTFQTWVGAADATEAEDFIFVHSVPPPQNGETWDKTEEDKIWPGCTIETPDAGEMLSLDLSTIDGIHSYLATLAFALRFETKIDDSEFPVDMQEEFRKIENTTIDILADMLEVAGAGSYWAATGGAWAASVPYWEAYQHLETSGRLIGMVLQTARTGAPFYD